MTDCRSTNGEGRAKVDAFPTHATRKAAIRAESAQKVKAGAAWFKAKARFTSKDVPRIGVTSKPSQAPINIMGAYMWTRAVAVTIGAGLFCFLTNGSVQAATLEDVIARLERLEKENATLRKVLEAKSDVVEKDNAALRERIKVQRETTPRQQIEDQRSPGAALRDAYAADAGTYVKTEPPSAAIGWTGFYAGVNVGYGQTAGSASFTPIEQTFFAASMATGEIPTWLKPNARGFIGGIQAGYNYQSGPHSMFGFEADISYSGIRGASSHISTPTLFNPTITTTQSEKLDWFGTFRGRAGFLPTPSLLAYVTGGLAFGQGVATTGTTVSPGLIGAPPTCGPAGNIYCSDGSFSKTLLGWTVGGGFEHLIGRNWSAKVEYLYYDLGHESYTVVSQAIPSPAVMQADASFRGHIARFGFNYKFGGPALATY